MKLETVFPGRVHVVVGDELIASRGTVLYDGTMGGGPWRRIARVPVSPVSWLKALHPLSRRLFRAEVHHVVHIANKLVVFAFGLIHVYNCETGAWEPGAVPVQGSRPLCVTRHGNALYYGEYRSNPERGPARIFKSADQGKTWWTVHTRNDIRHIHGVFSDPFSGALWFTTGDEDNECGIWCTVDDFNSVERVLSGSQQFRAVSLVFSPEHVYFGTDTPSEQNFIYRFAREGGTPERLSPVPSSIFYGCRVRDQIFFASVCEPSAVNQTGYVVLLGSNAEGSQWREVLRLKKDIWSMKYFQYGQIRFPAGENRSGRLLLSPLSLQHDQATLALKLDAIG